MDEVEVEKVKEIFSKNLKQYMAIYNLNQEDVAKITGVSRQSVSYWLNKKIMPRMGVIEKLATYFDVWKSDLLEDKGESKDWYKADTKVERANMQRRTLESVKGLFDEEAYTILLNYLTCDEAGKKWLARRSIEATKLYPAQEERET